MSRPLYITTPIYYVNDRPHIGHAYTTIAADLIARFHKLAGRETFFLTGTDEHGTKIAEAAAKAGLAPQEFCDTVVKTFQTAWQNLDIANDYFIRTTSERHAQAVEKILDAMRSAKTADGREVIYSSFYEGLYCTGCEKFLTEKELENGLCPEHKTVPQKLKEKNYFFRLTAFLPAIRDEIKSGRMVILPEEKRNEVLGLINQDLPDFSLSRERVTWGIPLSFDKSQVAYVWVDALSNYISAIGYGDDPKGFEKWWNSSEVVHLMGKEILKFHCLYWPAMLMAAGIKIPDTIYLHGWFTVDGGKMSKTLGNVIDPNDMVAQFGSDGARYLLMTQYPFGIDGDIQAKRFLLQYNSDLANDLGNLVSRVVKLIETHCNGQLPAPGKGVIIEGMDELLQAAEAAPGSAYEHIKHYRLHAAVAEGLKLVRATNKFFNDTAPWKLAKSGETEKLGGILYACAEALRIVSILLYPTMPKKMMELRASLGLGAERLTLESASTFFELQPGTKIAVTKPLFPRLEVETEPATQSKPQGKATEQSNANDDNLLDISDFGKVELKVAQVLSAEPVEGASKLLKLQIDLGSDKRQIVAGIAEYYTSEQIVGKKIIVVANLKPAIIRGVTSNGMLLAAKTGKKLFIVTPDGDLPPGAKVG
ncbi:MAG: methionine--tRNA ligase [candidate division Zixibacteria bacterium]|nr:methionine--tRNA ligase [candidate division Zixibacteria bacterium]